METHDVDRALSALADPTRRQIVGLLSARTYQASELADELSISRSRMSKHLKALLESGLVTDERVATDARLRIFRLQPEGLNSIRDWVAQTQALWDRQLASFKAHVEARQAETDHVDTDKGEPEGEDHES